jgi:glycosyltransferase involved in cell wall biosynthesis
MNPAVTIVTRTKDRPRLLARAMASVLAQTYEDWEHIIVNDGGEPVGLEQLAKKHAEAYRGRLTVLHHETARGMQEAANAGIAAGQGAFLCLHDDDDSWAPEHLAAVVGFLDKAGPDSPYQGVIGRTELVEEKITAKGRIEELDRRPYIPLGEISLFRLGFENPFPPIAFCFRRRAYEAVGPFNPAFTVAGDYDFNFRFARRFEIGVLDDVTAFYHLRRDPAEKAEGNSVRLAAREHKLRYNELKNHYLREAGTELDASLALAFNAARYLVEIEWVAHETRQRVAGFEGALAAHGERLLDALAPQATARYREELLQLLHSLALSSERHAENLWKDLNERNRESTRAIEDLTGALARQNDRLPGVIQESLGDVGRESSLLALGERLDGLEKRDRGARIDEIRDRVEGLAAALDKVAADLWADLNARAREQTAAIENAGREQASSLGALGEAVRETAELVDRPGREAAFARLETELARQAETQNAHQAELRRELARQAETQTTHQAELRRELARQAETQTTHQAELRRELARQAETQKAQQAELRGELARQAQAGEAAREALSAEFRARHDALAQQLEKLTDHLTTLREDLETERESQRSLFGLGRLGLVWKRRPAAPPPGPPPPDAAP